jgi:hypothetical protein
MPIFEIGWWETASKDITTNWLGGQKAPKTQDMIYQ